MRLLQFLYLIGGVYVSGSDGPISNDTQLGTHLTHKKLHGPRQTAIMMENVVAASAQSQAHTKNTLYHLRAWLLPNQKTLWSLDTINGRSLNGSYGMEVYPKFPKSLTDNNQSGSIMTKDSKASLFFLSRAVRQSEGGLIPISTSCLPLLTTVTRFS